MGYESSLFSLDGWMLAMFFLWVFIDQDGVEVHDTGKEKEWCQSPAFLTEQAWSIGDLLYGFQGMFHCRTQQLIQGVQGSFMSSTQVANHSAD